MTRLERCKDCFALIEVDNTWHCDVYDKLCNTIDLCEEFDKDPTYPEGTYPYQGQDDEQGNDAGD